MRKYPSLATAQQAKQEGDVIIYLTWDDQVFQYALVRHDEAPPAPHIVVYKPK